MGKPKFQSLKGIRDIYGDEQEYMERIYKVAKKIANYYGFSKIELPILEETEVFSKGIGLGSEVVQKQMFSFKTKGKEEVTLRPEGTASVVRAYIENGLKSTPSPTKFWYFGPMFRYENPQKGRYRQFYHFGVETLRENDPVRDAETIVVLYKILERLKINNIVVEVNNIGDECCRPAYVRKLKKYFKSQKHYLCSDCKKRLKEGSVLRILDCKKKKCGVVVSQAPKIIDNLCKKCHKDFKELLEFLDELEIPYILNPYLVRGLDYYTSTVFEMFSVQEKENEEDKKEGKEDEKESESEEKENEEDKKEEKKKKTEENEEKEITKLALGGGGRYDHLVSLLGGKGQKPTPAVGGALGIDRIVEIMKEQEVDLYERDDPEIFLAQVGALGKRKSLKLKGEFMKARMPVLESFGKDSLRTQLKIANKNKVKVALILGQKEALKDKVLIRDMETGKQETVKIKNVVDKVKKILK
jgi:histidyl-tRNA synthetase